VKGKMLVVDGSHLTYRHHSTTTLTTKDGISTGAVIGTLKSLANMVQTFKPKYCVVLYDKGRNKLRRELMGDRYKKKKKEEDPVVREQKEKDKQEYYKQVDILLDMLPSLGMYALGLRDQEADDGAAILADIHDDEVILASGDKDWLQLVNEKVSLYNPSKNKLVGVKDWHEYTEETEKGKLKVPVEPESWKLYRGLVGDSSDKIPGLPRCGPVAASEWVQGCSTYQEMLKKYADNEKIYKKLVEHREDVEIYIRVMDLTESARNPDLVKTVIKEIGKVNPIVDTELFVEKCRDLEFKTIYTAAHVFVNKFRTLRV